MGIEIRRPASRGRGVEAVLPGRSDAGPACAAEPIAQRRMGRRRTAASRLGGKGSGGGGGVGGGVLLGCRWSGR